MRLFRDKKTRKACRIFQMLSQNKRREKLPLHTPGHKWGRWDITELSYSDNLSAPSGCIAAAERDIAEILGAKKSFLLTDGSTAGVLSMLFAASRLGARKILLSARSHKSVFNGCKIAGLIPLVYTEAEGEFPSVATLDYLEERFASLLSEADCLLLTSPDYYGNVAKMGDYRDYCDRTGKILLVDGAHGGHLHFDGALYAGAYADLWVDGVHKSLPAFTQGAIVSARTEAQAEALKEGVDIFRTTSPSYPIMASVEYAARYPRNLRLEKATRAWIEEEERLYKNGDWTKIVARFGKNAFAAHEELEKRGIYPEFCDGNAVVFYLSPVLTLRDLKKLKTALRASFVKYPYEEEKRVQRNPAPLLFPKNEKTKRVDLGDSVGKICAADCGLFPPCTPLIMQGERISEEKIRLLRKSANVYGLTDRKILIYEEE